MQSAYYAAGVSLYPSDVAQLGLLVRRLAAKGRRVRRTYLVRVLAHAVAEPEMLGASIRHHAARQQRPKEAVAMNANVRLLKADVEKLFRVEDRLEKLGIASSHTEVLRAVWFYPPATPALCKAVTTFAVKFPDGRRAG